MRWSFIVRRARRQITRQRGAMLALTAAFTLLVLLLGGGRLAGRVAASLAPRLADNVHVIAYLRDDMTTARAAALADLVRRIPGIESANLVGSAEALSRLRGDVRAMGGAAELLDGVEDGFLPRSLELRLAPSATLGTRAADLAGRIRRIEGIAEVDAMEDGLLRVRAVISAARAAGIGLFGLALFSGLALLLVPLSRGRRARREEAEVLTLLGETPRAIRLPVALTGAAAALLGAIIAVPVLYAVFALWQPSWAEITRGLGVDAGGRPLAVSFLGGGEMMLGTAALMTLGFFLGRASIPARTAPHHAH